MEVKPELVVLVIAIAAVAVPQQQATTAQREDIQVCTLLVLGSTHRAHHQCVAGREDEVLLRLMPRGMAQNAAHPTRTTPYYSRR